MVSLRKMVFSSSSSSCIHDVDNQSIIATNKDEEEDVFHFHHFPFSLENVLLLSDSDCVTTTTTTGPVVEKTNSLALGFHRHQHSSSSSSDHHPHHHVVPVENKRKRGCPKLDTPPPPTKTRTFPCKRPRSSLWGSFTNDDFVSQAPSTASATLPNAWVCCDLCCKWRRTSTQLAHSIDSTHCRWTCSDNLDKAFSHCSIPQEKSDAEIDAELGITAADQEDASSDPLPPIPKQGFQGTAPQQPPWKPINSNLFLHRRHRRETADEILICNCTPPLDGGLGCGDGCLNRIISTECVRGTCPCGDRCSNQQFQKRMYAQLECFPCGNKGYGLRLLQSVSRGDFLIEYVGEVVDHNTYEARKTEYASAGQEHFYFMTIIGGEVIDSCAKGNLGRFINHSCDPNCHAQKWMVKGEMCIGFFAIRDIQKGEEVTFDYNCVHGTVAVKCVCGSSKCRGYIGGNPLKTNAVNTGTNPPEGANTAAYNHKVVSGTRRSSGGFGTRYLTQQKWNNVRCPRVRNRTGWGLKANNSLLAV